MILSLPSIGVTSLPQISHSYVTLPYLWERRVLRSAAVHIGRATMSLGSTDRRQGTGYADAPLVRRLTSFSSGDRRRQRGAVGEDMRGKNGVPVIVFDVGLQKR